MKITLDREMKAEDVLAVYDMLERNHIPVWLNGGWGVDALLEEQTRPHQDVDIVVQRMHVRRMRALLEKMGYTIVRDEEKWWNFVLGDGRGREVDVHVVTRDDQGNGHYGPQKMLWPPAHAFEGLGLIGGRPVRCLTADRQMADHTGYPPREYDFQDVNALHRRFGTELPAEYSAPMQSATD